LDILIIQIRTDKGQFGQQRRQQTKPDLPGISPCHYHRIRAQRANLGQRRRHVRRHAKHNNGSSVGQQLGEGFGKEGVADDEKLVRICHGFRIAADRVDRLSVAFGAKHEKRAIPTSDLEVKELVRSRLLCFTVWNNLMVDTLASAYFLCQTTVSAVGKLSHFTRLRSNPMIVTAQARSAT
jgi:hypothetical protein